MAFLSVSLPWAVHLGQVVGPCLERAVRLRSDLGAVEVVGDERAGLVRVRAVPARPRVPAAWVLVDCLAPVWPSWLSGLGVGLEVSVPGFVTVTDALVMDGVAAGAVGRVAWLEATTHTGGPRITPG